MLVFASSDSTEQDKQCSLELRKDGTKPVEVDRRSYWPKLTLVYEEPEYFPEDDGLDILFRESGKALLEESKPLPPHTDIIEYGPEKQDKLDQHLQWGECQRVPIRNYGSHQEILGCF